MTRDDIAQQLVITISGHALKVRLERVLADLSDYSPVFVTDWEIKDEKVEVLFTVEQFEVVPPREVIDHLKAKYEVDIEPNVTMSQAAVPNDPLYQDHWAFYKPQWDLYQMDGRRVGNHRVPACRSGRGIDSASRRFIPTSLSPAPGQQTHWWYVDSVIEDDGHGTFRQARLPLHQQRHRDSQRDVLITVRLMVLKFYDPWNPLTLQAPPRRLSGCRAIPLTTCQDHQCELAHRDAHTSCTTASSLPSLGTFLRDRCRKRGTNNDDPHLLSTPPRGRRPSRTLFRSWRPTTTMTGPASRTMVGPQCTSLRRVRAFSARITISALQYGAPIQAHRRRLRRLRLRLLSSEH
jgi:hypothetical protein